MKPLLSVISYNRRAETCETIRSLGMTGALEDADYIVWDNGSVDGTPDMLRGMVQSGFLEWDRVFLSQENIGCPKALNAILYSWRKPGQHYIKVDNDVLLETPDWVIKLVAFLEQQPTVALASAWYVELDDGEHGRFKADHGDWHEVFPIVGHCVIHRGSFLDHTGYFDVLAPDHLYGFEDVLMAHRATVMEHKCAVVSDVRLRNIQRHSSLDVGQHDGERMKEHVDRLRPEYDRRKDWIHSLGCRYYVSPSGSPVL